MKHHFLFFKLAERIFDELHHTEAICFNVMLSSVLQQMEGKALSEVGEDPFLLDLKQKDGRREARKEARRQTALQKEAGGEGATSGVEVVDEEPGVEVLTTAGAGGHHDVAPEPSNEESPTPAASDHVTIQQKPSVDKHSHFYDRAKRYYAKMCELKVPPSEITFYYLMRIAESAGEWRDAETYFKTAGSVTEFVRDNHGKNRTRDGLETVEGDCRNAMHWNLMLRIYLRHGEEVAAKKTRAEMESLGFAMDALCKKELKEGRGSFWNRLELGR